MPAPSISLHLRLIAKISLALAARLEKMRDARE
jgi:hypothetical protein